MLQPSHANKYLIQALITELHNRQSVSNHTPRIMNIGGSKKVFFEDNLTNAHCNYIADRIDIEDCTVTHQHIEKCLKCSVESMHPINSDQYDLVFANWVLEHVSDLNVASKEINRILKPAGKFYATIPNPAAPEFLFAKLTPLWIHKMMRGRDVDAWETYYAYSNIKEVIMIFKNTGLKLLEVKYFPAIDIYLARFPMLGFMGSLYANIISKLNIRPLLGHTCIVFEKPSP